MFYADLSIKKGEKNLHKADGKREIKYIYVLYCTVLYCIVLYCSVVYFIVLYCIILFGLKLNFVVF